VALGLGWESVEPVGLFNILLHLDHDCLDGLVFDGYIMSGAFG
jgi:hypothetical protein